MVRSECSIPARVVWLLSRFGKPLCVAPLVAAPWATTACAQEQAAAEAATRNAANAAIATQATRKPPGPPLRERDDEGLNWRIPPVRWGGSVGYSLQRNSSAGGQSSTSQGVFSNLNASSYIYAPWFATVSGRMGLTSSSSGSSSGPSQGSGPPSSNSGNSQSTSVVGGGELNVFPTSRFPFQAFFDRSDSRASGNLVSNDYVNTRFGLRQTYRGEDGRTSAGAQFDRSTVTSSLGGNDTLTAVSGNYATELGIVRNSISGRYSVGKRDRTGEQARLLGFNTSHTAALDDNINLSGNVSFLDNHISGGNTVGSFGDTRTRFLQINTFGTWMPEFEDRDDLPLTLSGGLRYANLRSEFSGQGIDSQSIGGNANALYRFSTNFTAGANVAVNQVRTSSGGSALFSVVGANANYTGDPLKFGNYSYNWNAGGSASWQGSGGEAAASVTTGAQLGHTLGRYMALSDNETLSVSVAQTVSLNNSQVVGNATTLSHSVAANYGVRWNEEFTGNLSASLSDMLTSGANAQHYRVLNVSANGMGQLSPLSSVNVNLQLNWNQQKTDETTSFGFPGSNTTNNDRQQMTLLGSASYTHSRFFGVRALRYNLLFTADTRLRDDRLLGNVNGEIERARWTLTNRLDYRIGLLDFRLSASINEVGGKKNALLFFQVTRQFGAY